MDYFCFGLAKFLSGGFREECGHQESFISSRFLVLWQRSSGAMALRCSVDDLRGFE